MRRKNIKSGLYWQSIGEILSAALKRKGLSLKLDENNVLKLWPKAVGPQIALQTQSDAVRNGILFVKTTSSVWVQQLHFMKDDILRKLNELAGVNSISAIRFTIGHKTSDRAGSGKETSPLKKSYLKDRDKKMIDECTGPITDNELAAILKRVMKAEINRRRRMQQRQDH